MDLTIKKSIVLGNFNPPCSPALAHRAIILSSLVPGHRVIGNVPENKEIETTIKICNKIGADIVREGGTVDIFGAEEINFPKFIDFEESNTTLKLFLALLGLDEQEKIITGSGKLLNKELLAYFNYLSRLGMKVSSEGKLPATFSGTINENELVYYSSLGTQFLSGILFLAPFVEENLEIGIEGKTERWDIIESTIGLLKESGVTVLELSKELIVLEPVSDFYPPKEKIIPASKTLTAYFLIAGALGGKTTANGIEIEDLGQFKNILDKFEISYKSGKNKISTFTGAVENASFKIEELGPYIFHTIVLGAYSKKTEIEGIDNLSFFYKKRLLYLLAELKKMELNFDIEENKLTLYGGELSGAEVNSNNDAQIAIALSLACLSATGTTRIKGTDCINRVLPGFSKELARLGVIVKESNL